METTNDAQVKVLFKFYSDMMDQDARETLLANTINGALGHYQIISIPFYITGIATEDTVYADFDEEEGMLVYKEKVQSSGNSIIWIAVLDDEIDIDEITEIFTTLNCYSATMSERYFSMEIKSETNYLKVKDRLNQLKSSGLIDYAEACISAAHNY